MSDFPRNADPLVAADEDEIRKRLFAPDTDPESLERKRKLLFSRHDDALLRIYLSAMPLGKYHTKDTDPVTLFCDGEPVMYLGVVGPNLSVKVAEGCVAALVHLLNTREQTEIPRPTAPQAQKE